MRSRLAIIFICVVAFIPGWFAPQTSRAQQPAATFHAYLPVVTKPVEATLPSLDLVNAIGGSMTAVAVEGRYAYVGEGAGLTIFDINDPAQPKPVGRIALATIQDIEVINGVAYLASIERGLLIVDVQDPAAPRLLGRFTLDTPLASLQVAGTLVYVAAGVHGLQIVDVSNSAQPTLRGSFLAEQSVNHVSLDGSTAYVTTGEGNLLVVDVSDPAHPQQIGRLAAPESASYTDIQVANGLVYTTYNSNFVIPRLQRSPQIAPPPAYAVGLHIVDIRDRSQPKVIGSYEYQSVYELHLLDIGGTTVYLKDTVVKLLDVATPTAPTLIPTASDIGGANALRVSGGRAFIVEGGLVIADIHDPHAISRVGTYTPDYVSWDSLLLDGQRIYTPQAIFDLGAPEQPQKIGALSFVPFHLFLTTLQASGNYLYAYGSTESGYGWLGIFDVRDPAQQTLVTSIEVKRGDGMIVAGTRAYILDYDGGFQVVDIRDPANPSIIASEHAGGVVGVDLAVVGTNLYFMAGDRLLVYDISNLAAPVLKTTVLTGCLVYKIMYAENRLYATGSTCGVQVYDVSDPFAPQRASVALPGVLVNDVVVEGTQVYAATRQGVQVVDLHDLAEPKVVSSYVTAVSVEEMFRNGDLLYLGTDGLQIIRLR